MDLSSSSSLAWNLSTPHLPVSKSPSKVRTLPSESALDPQLLFCPFHTSRTHGKNHECVGVSWHYLKGAAVIESQQKVCVKLEVLMSGRKHTVHGPSRPWMVREPTFPESKDSDVDGQRNRCREQAAGVRSWRLMHCYFPAMASPDMEQMWTGTGSGCSDSLALF